MASIIKAYFDKQYCNRLGRRIALIVARNGWYDLSWHSGRNGQFIIDTPFDIICIDYNSYNFVTALKKVYALVRLLDKRFSVK